MKKKLYFLPYAGASFNSFKTLGREFTETVEFICMEYPGRGERTEESFKENVVGLTEDAYQQILEEHPEEYYLAGHCLGAILAYELCVKIMREKEIKLPKKVFVSGQGAPDYIVKEGLIEKEPFELMKYLNEQGAVDDALINPDTFRFVSDFYVPVIKADAAVYENYKVNGNNPKVPVDWEIMYGENDWKCSKESLEAWNKFVSGTIRLHKFQGNHYFINAMECEYAEQINKLILEM